jgi:hypothetical protein
MAVAGNAGRSLDLFFPAHCGRMRGQSAFIGRETITPRNPLCSVILWAKAFLSAVAEHLANPWFDGALLRRERPPSVRPNAEMSFRSAKDVPSKVRVIETGGLCQNGWIDGVLHAFSLCTTGQSHQPLTLMRSLYLKRLKTELR